MKKITEQKAEKAMAQWLSADIELAKIQAEKREKVTPIIQAYERQETEQSDIKKEAEVILEAFATQQRESLFEGDKKSVDFNGGKIGFKTSPAKLTATDWDAALERFKEWHPEFVIEKCELDKKGIIRNVHNFDEGDLDAAGLTISQDERFYVKS